MDEKTWRGKRMREAADAKHLSIKEIASRMHKAPSLISMWWAGKRNPIVDDIVKYASIVGVPVEYFLYKERRLPENQPLRNKMEALIEELRKAVETPEGYKIVYATDGTPICVQAGSSNTQEDIDAAAEILKYGVEAVREPKRA